MWPIEWHHCQCPWSWMTLKVTFAVWNVTNSHTSWNIARIYEHCTSRGPSAVAELLVGFWCVRLANIPQASMTSLIFLNTQSFSLHLLLYLSHEIANNESVFGLYLIFAILRNRSAFSVAVPRSWNSFQFLRTAATPFTFRRVPIHSYTDLASTTTTTLACERINID